jgi:hypothetical protein
VGLVYARSSLNGTSGYHAVSPGDGQSLFIDHTMTSVAATASATYRNLRGSIGPALYKMRVTQAGIPGGGPSATQSRWGFIALAGWSIPATSHLFFDAEIQYRHFGRMMVGPYTSAAPISRALATFPKTDVLFDDWFLGIGPGLRF